MIAPFVLFSRLPGDISPAAICALFFAVRPLSFPSFSALHCRKEAEFFKGASRVTCVREGQQQMDAEEEQMGIKAVGRRRQKQQQQQQQQQQHSRCRS